MDTVSFLAGVRRSNLTDEFHYFTKLGTDILKWGPQTPLGSPPDPGVKKEARSSTHTECNSF